MAWLRMSVVFVLAASALAATPADAIVHDLCGKRIALLGENRTHGFGRTMEFKAELVRRLIDDCHYNAFFIESGIYDFLNIQKKLKSGQEITAPMIAAAIGGLWATREVEPLIPFLLERARGGKVVLGGLDNQLARGTYAQRSMPADLVEYLSGEEKPRCLAILQRHMLWQYESSSPYSPQDRTRIVGCLDSIGAAIPPGESDGVMVESLKWILAQDFPPEEPAAGAAARSFNARDESMYRNFQWLMSRLSAHSKVIVWGATIHMAKDLRRVPGEERTVSLGSFISREFKSQSFALGFSAYSGSYGRARQPVRQLSAAPGGSLEGQALANNTSDTVYLGSRQIRKLGSVAARPLGTEFQTAKWDDVLDGIVVFRAEHPPAFGGQ